MADGLLRGINARLLQSPPPRLAEIAPRVHRHESAPGARHPPRPAAIGPAVRAQDAFEAAAMNEDAFRPEVLQERQPPQVVFDRARLGSQVPQPQRIRSGPLIRGQIAGEIHTDKRIELIGIDFAKANVVHRPGRVRAT